ncbi:hypothetical protein CEP54_013137 [Fusarium duplospermum]|uniref:Uncharacterized protein n=1 Tax=Fusarium duplospermum TaxID=1325734 RepID=A0A428P4M6_9HYPO|nr:hypothetical protein CEP54_013137 [Fusarium duplospermum]
MPNDIKAKFQAISDIVAHYDSLFDAILSPTEKYQEQEAEINGRIDEFRVNVESAPPDTRWELMERAIEQGKRLKELEIRYTERASTYETDFNENLQKTFDSFCCELVDIVGLKRIVALTRDSADRDSSLDPDDSLESQAWTTSPGSTAVEQSIPAQLSETGLGEDYVAATQRGKRESNPVALSNRAKRRKTIATTHHNSEAEPKALSPIARERQDRPETRRLRSRLSESTRHQKFQGITDPRPGKVYFGFRKKSKQWLAVLVLPLQNLQQVGLDGTLDTFGLAETLPVCYKHDKSRGSLSWRVGYKDGEDKVSQREFPVMYFDGHDIPDKCTFGWMPANDLRPFDAGVHSELVENISSVRKFLKAYGTESTKKGTRNEPDGSSDGFQNDVFSSCVSAS